MARGRGGARTPENPAPVSGPGALSARTDGGPSQPIRVAPGGPYGQAQQLTQAQQAVPLPEAPPSPAPPASGGGGQAPLPSPVLDAFGPTRRPGEPANRGLGPGTIVAEDPDVLLKRLYALLPHPDIARLIG